MSRGAPIDANTDREVGPHPNCSLCSSKQPCAWHAARTTDAFMKVTAQTLQKRLLRGLADLFEASFAGMTDLPENVYEFVAGAPSKALNEEFARILSVDHFDTAQLRRLAAVALALAVHYEAKEAKTDGVYEEDDD